MKWLVVLDPVEGLAPETDTSLTLIKEARATGLRVDTTTIDRLYFDQEVRAIVCTASGVEESRSLGEYHLVFMRKEPPYDLAFHYATQLLALAGTLVVNSPRSLQAFNEKLIALTFPQYMPPTLVSSRVDVIVDFLKRHDGGVVKALDSFQGRSVMKIGPEQIEEIERMTARSTRPIMVQKFLDQVYEGDKRVIMLGERYLGAALRRPKKGYHANFANSDALAAELLPREKEILAELGPWMVRQGIHFAGLDFIGGFLTEINITCPTGIVQISALENRSLAKEIVRYFIEMSR